jgi:hypothetical protein
MNKIKCDTLTENEIGNGSGSGSGKQLDETTVKQKRGRK